MGQKAIGIVVGIIAGAAAFYVASKGISSLLGQTLKTKHVAEASLKPGWQKFESAKDGFSIATPKNYTQLDPRSPDIQSAMQEAIRLNPSLSSSIQAMSANQDIKMYAIDLQSAASGFATNINVVKKTLKGGLVKTDKSLAEFRKGLESTLPPSMRVTKVEFAELPIGTSVLSEVEMELNGATGPIKAKSAIYMVPNGTDSYSVTFACSADKYQALRPGFTEVVNTLRLD